MKSSTTEITPILGAAMGGGYYAGRILIDGQAYALILAPKDGGQHDDTPWNASEKTVAGALSYCDGLANTSAMAEAGSALAQWALDLRIGGHDDWYLPSQDELEICYRNLKPTARANWCYACSGVNLSAIEPTRPYTPDHPAQTVAEAFKEGEREAFDPKWYWTSTQHASDASYAWYQNFYYGNQDVNHQNYELRARAVRRLPL